MLKALDPSLSQNGNTIVISLKVKENSAIAAEELHDLFVKKKLSEVKLFTDSLREINDLQELSIDLHTETIDNIIFDVSDMPSISSSALAPFLKANKFLSTNGSINKVILLNPQERVRKIFEQTKLIDTSNTSNSIFAVKYGTPENMSDTLQSNAE